jgi:predicted permease
MRNVKLAFRTLLRTPFVTTVAILSLALGIGANAAIFSLFDQMLLQALPVSEPGRLVNLSAPGPKPGSQSCNQAGDCDVVFSYPMFRDLERASTGLAGIAAHRAFGANLAFRNQTLNGEGMLVSGSYFPLLGLRPALGRLLTPADDETVGGHFVAVLSHRYWESGLGADPDVLNRTIVVNGQSMTIVGVAPRGFDGTTLGARPQVFVPITMRGLMSPGFEGFDNRRSYWAYLFGRLRPGVSLEQVAASLNAVYRPIIADVEAPMQEGMSDQTMSQFLAKEITLEAGTRGQSSVHGEARMPLVLLFATTGIVLLIACANIANLLLARGAGRSMEMAVRLSLGASRRQVLTQLLTESVVLALLGGLASIVVAQWTLSLIGSILPPEALTTLRLEIQPSVILFAGGLAIATGLLFGLFPALHSTRPDLVTTMRANTGQIAGARSAATFRSGLVTLQIALSMALLIPAGLFLRSLANLGRVDLGLRTENVVTFRVSPELNGYESERAQVFFQRLEEELAATPGVTAVTAALVPVLAGSNWGTSVAVEGFESGPDTDTGSRYNEVGPGFFRTLGIPLIAGREFTRADGAGGAKVAIVNEEFARKFGLGRDAVGKLMAQNGEQQLDIEIVGFVQDAKYSEVKDDVPPLFFTPYLQDENVGSMSFYVRTRSDPRQVLRTLPSVVARLDPNIPVENLKTLPQQVRENVFLDRMISTLSAAFAGLATLLAAVGLYGVLSYTVSQRTREIGVRMALGANSGRVRWMVLRQVGGMIVIGGIIGFAAALGIGRAAGSLLFGLEGHDPLVFASAAVILALIALAAGYLPARRASRVDPMQALRYE